MKFENITKAIVFSLVISSFNVSNCQNIGFLINTDFSIDNKINGSIGGGFYVFWPTFNDRFEFQLSASITKNEGKMIEGDKNVTNEDIVSSYFRIGSSLSSLYVKPISKTMKLKLGPLVTYNYIVFSTIPIPFSVVQSASLHAIGTGFRTNFNFKVKEKSEATFDFIFDSAYLFKFTEYDYLPRNTELHSSFLYTFIIGLTYPF